LIAVVKRDSQVSLARRKGAQEVVQIGQVTDAVEAVRGLQAEKRGSDVVIEAVGRPEHGVAVQMVRKGGTVNFLGVAPRGAKCSSIQPPGLFGNHAEGDVPPLLRRVRSRVRADHGEKSAGTDYITGEAPLSRLHDVLRHMLNRQRRY